MSKAEKLHRARMYEAKNKKLIQELEKIARQYQHNFTCAKNLCQKAQEPIPDNMRYNYGYINYTSE